MYNRKQTFMSISFSINTQRTTQTMNLNQTLPINSNVCTWVFLLSSLLAPMLQSSIMLQYTMRVSISRFPLALFKLSNLELKFYLPALTILNASTY